MNDMDYYVKTFKKEAACEKWERIEFKDFVCRIEFERTNASDFLAFCMLVTYHDRLCYFLRRYKSDTYRRARWLNSLSLVNEYVEVNAWLEAFWGLWYCS